MQFIDFRNSLSNYHIFSLKDVIKLMPNIHRGQIDRWEKKNYLKKIKRSYYCFMPEKFDKNFLFYAANKIYSPSYVSLEIALKHYGLIPEEIFQITSISTKKTTNFDTPIGNFSYKHLKPSLFWGYSLIESGNKKILLADCEKAILDYLYLHPNLKTQEDFLEMRINSDEFRMQINPDKFQEYLNTFGCKTLTKRTNTFLNTLNQST